MSTADWVIRTFEPQIAALLFAIRRVETYLGPDDDWIEDDRRVIYEAADTILRPLGRSTISRVHEEDYVFSVSESPDEVEVILDDAGYQRNVLSTRKYREPLEAGRQWAVGSYVLDPVDEPWQQHVILFPNPGGGTDVYTHKEASVRRPSEHDGGDEQIAGDPDGRVEALFE